MLQRKKKKEKTLGYTQLYELCKPPDHPPIPENAQRIHRMFKGSGGDSSASEPLEAGDWFSARRGVECFRRLGRWLWLSLERLGLEGAVAPIELHQLLKPGRGDFEQARAARFAFEHPSWQPPKQCDRLRSVYVPELKPRINHWVMTLHKIWL